MTTYFIDPTKGNINNAGTQTAPWDTLANVVKTKKFNGGDVINLCTGYHGIPIFTGKNTSMVTVKSVPSNAPVIGGLVFNSGSGYWTVSGLTITRSLIPAGHPDNAVKISGVTISTQTAENVNNVTISNCSIYTQLDSSKWTKQQWNSYGANISIYGTNISFLNNHCFNNSKIYIGYHSNNCTVSNNLFENFATDGFDCKGNYLTFTNNIIRNSHKVNGNHNDLMQFWGTTGSVIKNNLLVAWLAGNKFLDGNGVADTQGMGGYDGGFSNFTIQNNEVYVDHPIGIWFLGPNNFNISNNFVRRCGKNSYFSPNRAGFALPSVTVWLSKSNKQGKNNVVANNKAEAFYINQSGGSFTGNVKISGTAKPTAPVVAGLTRDLVLTETKLIESEITDPSVVPDNCVLNGDRDPDADDPIYAQPSYQDIYNEVRLNDIPFDLMKTSIGTQLYWKLPAEAEGCYIYHNGEQIAKIFKSTDVVIVPTTDVDKNNFKITPYDNVKKL